MTIYLLINNVPENGMNIVSIHLSKDYAEMKMNRLKEKNSYEYQYLEIQKWKLEK